MMEHTQKQYKDKLSIEVAEIETQKRTVWARLRTRICDGWFWEIASLTCGALGITGMTIILWLLDGKELPWWSERVSPNTVLSMVSTATKAAVLLGVSNAIGQFKWVHLRTTDHSLSEIQRYDSASRGPIGAFSLFWNRINGPLISRVTMIGCVVMISAVAIDPSSQQFLKYIPEEVPVNGTGARISRTSTFAFGNIMPGTIRETARERDPQLVASFITAALGAPRTMKLSCPTAKCTYPDFTTLGVNTSCTNVTSQSDLRCISRGSGEVTCDMRLPGFDEYHPAGRITIEGSEVRSTKWDWEQTSVNMTVFGIPMNKDLNGGIAQISIVRFYGTPNHSSTSQIQWFGTADAWQCDLSFAAYFFSEVSIENNTVYTPKILQSGVTAYDNQTKRIKTNSLRRLITVDDSWPPDYRTIFRVNDLDWDDMLLLIEMLDMRRMPSWGDPLYIALSHAFAYPADIPRKIGEIADSLTYYMMSGTPNATVVEGTTYYPSTYIHVRWAWLSTSITLWVLSAVYLSAVILKTRSSGIPTWKSSLYPLLTLNMETNDIVDETGAPPTTDWTVSRMDKVCKTVRPYLFATKEKDNI